MEDAVGRAIFLCIYVLGAAGFFLMGIYTLRNPSRVTGFFHSLGTRTFGRRAADRIYTESGAKVAAIGFVVLAPIMLFFGIWTLLRVLTGLE